jgi:hypothetical protein
MVNEQLRQDLLAMRAEDQTVRQELIDSGELGGSYVPRMEDVHRKNAARLRDLIELYGWPHIGPFANIAVAFPAVGGYYGDFIMNAYFFPHKAAGWNEGDALTGAILSGKVQSTTAGAIVCQVRRSQ